MEVKKIIKESLIKGLLSSVIISLFIFWVTRDSKIFLIFFIMCLLGFVVGSLFIDFISRLLEIRREQK